MTGIWEKLLRSSIYCWIVVRGIKQPTESLGVLVITAALLRRWKSLVLSSLEPQSRFGGKLLKIRLVCPQNGTAVRKGLVRLSVLLLHRCQVIPEIFCST